MLVGRVRISAMDLEGRDFVVDLGSGAVYRLDRYRMVGDEPAWPERAAGESGRVDASSFHGDVE